MRHATHPLAGREEVSPGLTWILGAPRHCMAEEIPSLPEFMLLIPVLDRKHDLNKLD